MVKREVCEKCPNSAIAWRREALELLWKVQCDKTNSAWVIISEMPNFGLAVVKLGPVREEVIGVV